MCLSSTGINKLLHPRLKTSGPVQNGRHFSDNIFVNEFSWMILFLFKFHWYLFSSVNQQYAIIGSDGGLVSKGDRTLFELMMTKFTDA